MPHPTSARCAGLLNQEAPQTGPENPLRRAIMPGRGCPMSVRDTQSFCREAEEYTQAVVALMGEDEGERQAAAARVLARLGTVLEGMLDGMPPADMALALGRP